MGIKFKNADGEYVNPNPPSHEQIMKLREAKDFAEWRASINKEVFEPGHRAPEPTPNNPESPVDQEYQHYHWDGGNPPFASPSFKPSEFDKIREWASGKNIYTKGDIKTQTIKLYEEAGELAKAVLNEDTPEIEDAIGDMVVVLTSVAHMAGLSIEQCIESAYNVIAKRDGVMRNGTFIKNK